MAAMASVPSFSAQVGHAQNAFIRALVSQYAHQFILSPSVVGDHPRAPEVVSQRRQYRRVRVAIGVVAGRDLDLLRPNPQQRRKSLDLHQLGDFGDVAAVGLAVHPKAVLALRSLAVHRKKKGG